MRLKAVTDILLAAVILLVSACSPAPADSTEASHTAGTTTSQTTAQTTADTTPETTGTTAAQTTEAAQKETDSMTEKKVIALTFDDGPNTTTTNEVLDTLEKYGVTASFFLIGDNISDESAKAVKRAYDMGCEIGNHSRTHSDMSAMEPDEMTAEIEYVNEKIIEITGGAPKFFRPPYIAVSDQMFDTIELPFIAGYGANDWDDRVTADNRARRVLKQAKDGAIILLHDAKGNSMTVEALDTIIPELLSQGYEFVTISEVFSRLNVEPKAHDKKVYSFAEQEYMYG